MFKLSPWCERGRHRFTSFSAAARGWKNRSDVELHELQKIHESQKQRKALAKLAAIFAAGMSAPGLQGSGDFCGLPGAKRPAP
jgi:hypothetical protein